MVELSAFAKATVEAVRTGGLEPPHLAVPDPKSGASTNSATSVGTLKRAAKIAVAAPCPRSWGTALTFALPLPERPTMKHLDPTTLSVGELHGYLVGAIGPRPVALASTVDDH